MDVGNHAPIGKKSLCAFITITLVGIVFISSVTATFVYYQAKTIGAYRSLRTSLGTLTKTASLPVPSLTPSATPSTAPKTDTGALAYEAEQKTALTFAAKELGVNVPALPKTNIMTSDELQKKVRDQIKTPEANDKKIRDFQAFLESFGYIEKGTDTNELIAKLVESQAALPIALYDPENKELFISANASVSRQFITYLLAHELTHYLQDTYYGLEKRTEQFNDSTMDQYYTFLALVEGQASVVAERYKDSLTPKERVLIDADMDSVASDSPREIFPFDQRWVSFVYGNGTSYASRLDIRTVGQLISSSETFTSNMIYTSSPAPDKRLSVSYDVTAPAGYTFSTDDVLGDFGCRTAFQNLGSQVSAMCDNLKADLFKIYQSDTASFSTWVMQFETIDSARSYLTPIRLSLQRYGTRALVSQNGNRIVVVLAPRDEPALEGIKVSIRQ